jgi:hypothetical protein
MSASINDSWSSAPASTVGAQHAAPYVKAGPPSNKPAPMTIDGLTPEAARKLAAEKAAAAQVKTAPVAPIAAQTNAEKALKAHLESVRSRADGLSEIGYRHEVAAFTDTAAAKLAAEAPTQAREALTAARQRVADVRRAIAAPTDSVAADRAVRRHEARLAASEGDSIAVARQIVSDASTRAELQAAVEATQAHLDAKGIDDTWLQSVVAAKVPELADAIDAERQAQKIADVVTVNDSRLQNAISSGHALAVPLTQI